MIAPPNLCGNPELVEVQHQQQTKDHVDEDSIPPPSYPLRRFRFRPTWMSSSSSTSTIKEINENEQQESEEKEKVTANHQHELELFLKSYIQLPPSDAVALFSGEDFTGLMTWMGSARLSQHLYDNFLMIQEHHVLSQESSVEMMAAFMINDKKDDTHDKSDNTKLQMSSFVKESLDERMIRELQNVDTVVEIGCGSGLLGLVAGYALNAKSIIFTDGNSDCTELAEENFNLNRDKVFRQNNVVAVGKGQPFMWKDLSDEEVSKILFSHRKSNNENGKTTKMTSMEFTKESSIVICGGDIVYDFDAVEPLVQTVDSLAKGFCDVRNVMCDSSSTSKNEEENSSTNLFSRAHFFLCFYPRQWYVSDNRILLENVKDKLASRGWRLCLEAGSGDNDGTLLHFVLERGGGV